MTTLQTIKWKMNEMQELEFTNPWESKYYHLPIIDGNFTPLCYIPSASTGSVLFITGVPIRSMGSRFYDLIVKNTYWIGKIYILDAPEYFVNQIEEVKCCDEFYGLSFEIEKNNAKNIHNIIPNLSKYIPENNAVLFLSEMDRIKFVSNDNIFNNSFDLDSFYKVAKLLVNPPRKLTISLHHGTQSELQKANEVVKELRGKYGVKEVNLFALHCFGTLYINRHNYLSYQSYDFLKNPLKSIRLNYINKIITTNSTGILKPEDSNERLQVIDCKKMFEDSLKTERVLVAHFL